MISSVPSSPSRTRATFHQKEAQSARPPGRDGFSSSVLGWAGGTQGARPGGHGAVRLSVCPASYLKVPPSSEICLEKPVSALGCSSSSWCCSDSQLGQLGVAWLWGGHRHALLSARSHLGKELCACVDGKDPSPPCAWNGRELEKPLEGRPDESPRMLQLGPSICLLSPQQEASPKVLTCHSATTPEQPTCSQHSWSPASS